MAGLGEAPANHAARSPRHAKSRIPRGAPAPASISASSTPQFVCAAYDHINRDIPATNNGSERALRPCATFRKITNGFRTERRPKL
jgi:hypothetical protein